MPLSGPPFRRLAGAAAGLAAAGLLAACAVGGGGPGAPREVTGPVATWTGGLHCAQGFGDARATLTLGTGRGRVAGVLAYEVTEPFTQIAPGRLRMEGTLGADGALTLKGTRWIDWPEGQALFGLTARLDAKKRSMSGTVPECGEGSSLYLERVSE